MQKQIVNTLHDKDAPVIDKGIETPAISFSLLVLSPSSRMKIRSSVISSVN
jgi:hypothetical protein